MQPAHNVALFKSMELQRLISDSKAGVNTSDQPCSDRLKLI